MFTFIMLWRGFEILCDMEHFYQFLKTVLLAVKLLYD